MKKLILATLLITSISVFAKNITKQILVKGNCEKCEVTIETALDVPGISFADWDKETKMLTVRFNDKKITEDQIHGIISSKGYATDKVAANKAAQNALADCCKPKTTGKKGCCSGKAACSKKK